MSVDASVLRSLDMKFRAACIGEEMHVMGEDWTSRLVILDDKSSELSALSDKFGGFILEISESGCADIGRVEPSLLKEIFSVMEARIDGFFKNRWCFLEEISDD